MALYKTTHRIVNKRHIYQFGFSLIELLVVIMMLGVLLVALVMAFDPITQYNKTKDSQREHDLGQIQRALDAYFNDTKCYPTTLTFGAKWSVNTQTYMQVVPQDPNCSTDTSKCYVYQAEQSSCPQWNVLYASLRAPAASANENACPLLTRNAAEGCLPNGFTNIYNYCVVSGGIDCSAISTSTIVSSGGSGGSSGGGGGGGGGASPTPTPTPVLSCPGDAFFACTGDDRCNSIGLDPVTHHPLACSGYGGPVECYCDQHCYQSCTYN